MSKLVTRVTRVLFCVLLGFVLLLLLAFPGVQHACRRGFLLPNVVRLAGALLLRAGVMLLPLRAPRSQSYGRWVMGLSIALFLMQSFVTLQTCFQTGWDAGVICDTAQTLAFGDIEEIDNSYFSTYPNNLLMASIASWMMQLDALLGIEDALPILSLLVLNCAVNAVSCALVYRVLRLVARERTALLGFALSVALVGFSPWSSIPYTDALALLFPILLLFLFLRPSATQRGSVAKWAIFGIVAAIGFSLKPQTLIVPIAAGLIALGARLGRGQGRRLGALLLAAALASGCFAGVRLGLDALYRQEGFVIDPESRFGPSHFVMMGLNEQSNGVWAEEDVSLSAACDTASERAQLNWTESARRLRGMGAWGLARHLGTKTLVNFHDGTFAWGCEGSFFVDEYDPLVPELASLLRSVFYPHGETFPVASTAAQGIWLAVLCLSFFAGLCARGANTPSVLLLSLVGLMLYSLLFEARARYLYHFAPLFCVAAALGVQALRDLASAPRRRLRSVFVR